MKSLGTFVIALGLVSCATERTVVNKESKKMSERMSEAFQYEKGEDGQMRMKNGKPNEFASRSFDGSKTFENKEVSAGKYSTQKWSGVKDYQAKDFGDRNKNAFNDTPYFVTKQAQKESFSGRKDFNGKQADISKDSWAQAGRQVENKIDSKVAETPEMDVNVTEFRDYAKKSVEETNSLLGRQNDK